MKKNIAASLILVLIVLGLGLVPGALANGTEETSQGKTFLVRSPEGELLGTAKKVLVNSLDEADFLIVSLQNEYGEKDVIVPFSAVSVADEDSVVLDLNKDLLARAPVYQRPELGNPVFFEEVYRFYGMTPPWTEK